MPPIRSFARTFATAGPPAVVMVDVSSAASITYGTSESAVWWPAMPPGPAVTGMTALIALVFTSSTTTAVIRGTAA